MKIVMSGLGTIGRLGKKVGPYLLLEILMPGGTLLALLLALYRQREAAGRIQWPRCRFRPFSIDYWMNGTGTRVGLI